MDARDRFGRADMPAFETTAEVGLLATLRDDGGPHVTLISSLQAKDPGTVIWGQFTEGLSKEHVRSDPRTAFLIMTLDRKLWRGRARWRESACKGQEYEMFNRKPMFRYNSYFGINTVHYMDLVEVSRRESLPLVSIAAGLVATRITRGAAVREAANAALSPWAMGLVNGPVNPKFIAFVGEDGYPHLVPLLQSQAPDRGTVVFSTLAYGRELRRIQSDSPVAIFGMTMQMESVLSGGRFRGFRRIRGLTTGTVEIDWVYNSMPPAHRLVYPPAPLLPVTDF
jgi:hypothetical protein